MLAPRQLTVLRDWEKHQLHQVNCSTLTCFYLLNYCYPAMKMCFVGGLKGSWTLSFGLTFSMFCTIFFFPPFCFDPQLLAVVCGFYGDEKAAATKKNLNTSLPCSLSLSVVPSPLYCQSFFLSFSLSLSVLHFSQVCLVSHLLAYFPPLPPLSR